MTFLVCRFAGKAIFFWRPRRQGRITGGVGRGGGLDEQSAMSIGGAPHPSITPTSLRDLQR